MGYTPPPIMVRLGISIPGELEILSFDDMPPNGKPLARYVHRLVQHPIEMGQMAAKRVTSLKPSRSLAVRLSSRPPGWN